MQEKPKPDEDSDSWAEDQKDHGYYYDDAHGYEKYEPDEECEEPEDPKEEAGASPPSGPANVVSI